MRRYGCMTAVRGKAGRDERAFVRRRVGGTPRAVRETRRGRGRRAVRRGVERIWSHSDACRRWGLGMVRAGDRDERRTTDADARRHRHLAMDAHHAAREADVTMTDNVSIRIPPWDGHAREVGEVWRLSKGSRVASCALW